MTHQRVQLALAVAVLVSSTVAFAQVRPADVMCGKTETQSECHDRLQCKPNEELEDCQRRLLKCKPNESLEDCKERARGGGGTQGNGGQRDNADNRGGQRDNADNRGGDRDTNNANRDRDADQNRRGREGDNGGRERRDRDRDRGRDGDRDRDRDRDSSGGGRRRQHGEGRGFEANKTFGLGLELGEPTGLNGKVFASRSGAVDFGLGYVYSNYYYGDGFHVYADYLWHPVSLASADAFELPFYLGVGLRYWDFDYCTMGVCYRGSSVGVRVPFGIAFDFNRVPLDIFLQVVPVIDFVSGDYYTRYGNREHFGIDASAGIRFWFK